MFKEHPVVDMMAALAVGFLIAALLAKAIE